MPRVQTCLAMTGVLAFLPIIPAPVVSATSASFRHTAVLLRRLGGALAAPLQRLRHLGQMRREASVGFALILFAPLSL
jgi:hypothetical protein